MNAVTREEKVLRFAALRAKLRESEAAPAGPAAASWQTGCEAIDRVTGGIRRGVLSEFSGSCASGGLFLGVMLEMLERERLYAALVDAADAFEPADFPSSLLNRLLWVRCSRTVIPAIRAVDLLLRDGNLPLVILDLQPLDTNVLRKIPVNTWHRFQRILESGSSACVVLTTSPMVEGARVRVTTTTHWTLDAMDRMRTELLSAMALDVREKFSGPERDGMQDSVRVSA